MFHIFKRSLVGKHAPELTGDVWFNATSLPEDARDAAAHKHPLRFGHELSGNVTLVCFWDYSDHASLEVLQYLHAWWEQYKVSGLLIIGVHVPQYAFAEDPDKVESAILRFGLDYPVLHDPSYTSWKRYDNTLWPRVVLVDTHGIVRDDIRGEGDIRTLEGNIKTLLQ